MCGTAEISMVLSVLGALVAATISAWNMRVVSRRLESAHPQVWSAFSKPWYLKYVETPHDEKFAWFVISGRYREIRDDLVTAGARKANWSGLLCWPLISIAAISRALPSYDSVFACVSPV